MPANVRLLSGPGCPVCVTAQGDIDQLIQLAAEPGLTLCTYGDMLRVPGRRGSLERARSRGADVRVVYSAMDAVRLAENHRGRQVVFGAVGFETTAPATAATVRRARERGLDNFSVLVSHKRVLPAMEALLASGQVQLDGLLCPGHVSVIMGWECYRPLAARHRLPCVIAGFEEPLLAAALAWLARQVLEGRAELLNQYPEAVTAEGNLVARRVLDEVFEPVAMRWRGLGLIPDSGLGLRSPYRMFDAARRFALGPPLDREPAACICGQVITGTATPENCRLFGDPCTPIHPVGPCMVSSEGTCQAWFKYRRPPAGLRRAAALAPAEEMCR
jgi:hydrogenase expression/formation protein HypD